MLVDLYARYEAEKETKEQTDGFIQDILDYYVSDDETILRDLQRKLTDANRENLMKRAEIYKHNFRKKLERFRLFPSAQKIYALLLGQALTRFDTYVEPHLDDELTSVQLKQLIEEKIVEYIMGCVPGAEPTVDSPSIHGMIYFLTGNCFIDWQKA